MTNQTKDCLELETEVISQDRSAAAKSQEAAVPEFLSHC